MLLGSFRTSADRHKFSVVRAAVFLITVGTDGIVVSGFVLIDLLANVRVVLGSRRDNHRLDCPRLILLLLSRLLSFLQMGWNHVAGRDILLDQELMVCIYYLHIFGLLLGTNCINLRMDNIRRRHQSIAIREY